MISILAKRISSRFFSPPPHHLLLLSPLLQRQLSTKSSPLPQKETPFMAQYLISSFGFSPDRALKVSANTRLKGIKSPDRPESVIKFLSDTGLSDTQIKAVVSFVPSLLGYNVDKTLKPRVHDLVQNGFSEELVVQLIRYCPHALQLRHTLSRLMFWRDLVSNELHLLKIIPRISFLITFDIDKYIAPRINVLKEYGLSNRDIVHLLKNGNRCMSLDLDSLRQTIELIEELGFARGSSKFLYGLKAVGSLRKDKILKKVEFYKTTYGWSQEDVHSAFRRAPYILIISEEKIKSNMDFLITMAKLEPRSIVTSPYLLYYSIKKRLRPRHLVLSILAARGLNRNSSLATACGYTEKRFLENYVEPYEKDVPEFVQIYFAASGNNVSP